MTRTAGALRIAYGPHPSQFGELIRPEGAGRGTVVLLHGGFWRVGAGLDLNRAQAVDLAAHGWNSWNVEYRRIGDGGGWPATFDDVVAALDHLSTLDVDPAAVVVAGHSAGGLLAAWLGGRDGRVAPRAVVVQAAVLDLGAAAREDLGNGAVADLLGGRPDGVPDRYRTADPLAVVPLGVPVLCVHGRADGRVPFTQTATYHAAALKAGAPVALLEVDGDHLAHLDPTGPAWTPVRDALPDLVRGRLPQELQADALDVVQIDACRVRTARPGRAPSA